MRVITDEQELQAETEDGKPRYSGRERRAKGWWSSRTGEVVVVLPNNADVADVENTLVHELIGHKGLRGLIGEGRFGEFLREMYDHATVSIRKKIDAITDRNPDWKERAHALTETKKSPEDKTVAPEDWPSHAEAPGYVPSLPKKKLLSQRQTTPRRARLDLPQRTPGLLPQAQKRIQI